MTVGKTDGSGVTLSGSQVQDHFTDKLENLSNNKNVDLNDPKTAAAVSSANTSIVAADPNGVWQLTKPGVHYYIDPNNLAAGPVKITDGPQVAHVSFENEIDFGHDFSMSGALGIGTNTGGADGVGIVFAPGDPEYATTGKSGGNLGLGGLNNAFAFVYDEFHNSGTDTSGVTDPGSGAYFGWRSTNANGVIQNVTNSNDWKAASSFTISDRLVDFDMSYVSSTNMLTVTILGQKFTRDLTGIDTSKGYSISIAASTGQDKNDYSARIDSFTYTPKTASVNVKVATASGDVSTTTPVTANIGDTISVFSTKEAAERAVAADPTLDPSLVTVIPASTNNNVYVVDGDQTSASNGTVHASSLADASYYSYKVTGNATQAFSVPVSQAFTANVTPVDSVTGDAIPGVAPIQVTTVAGKSTVVQFPGYTPVTVELNAPAAGETVANDKVKINTSTTASTETDVANPIEHYYTAAGETIDGTPVTAKVTVGTNQSVTDALNAQQPIGSDGKVITDGSTPAYTWSTVPNAAVTDSTDSSAAQDSKSILVPTQSTLDYWIQKATDNQAAADTEKAAAQDIYDKFVASPDITADQKAAAKSLLDSVNAVYENLSKTNADAKASLEAAKNSTDPATIVKDSQAGYAGISGMDTSLSEFKNDVDNMSTTNAATQASMVSFKSWSQDYGTPLENPKVIFGDGFSTTPVSDDQVAGLFADPANFYYVDALDSDTSVTPKDVGTYYFKLTEKGRTYIKNLTPDNPNAGLYVSGTVTINPVAAAPTIKDISVVYGAEPKITGSLGSDLANTDDPLTQDDFEIIDNATKEVVSSNQLQAGGDYTIQYTTDAQNNLKKDTNYTFGNFGTAKLTVTPAAGNVAVTGTSVTYGDSLPSLSVSVNGAPATAYTADNFEFVDTTTKSVVTAAKLPAGSYTVQLTQAAQDALSAANGNFKLTFGTGTLTVNKRTITVNINDVTTYSDGSAHGANGFNIAAGDKLVDGESSDELGVTLNPISETDIGTYTITGKSDSANYAVTVNSGTLKILGQTDDGKGNKTTTEKDAAGSVVRIDKQWADGSETIYKNDNGKLTVTDKKGDKTLDQQTFNPAGDSLTLTDDPNTNTIVALDPTSKLPMFSHETTATNEAGDTTTTTDAEGNVVKVVKQWPDGTQTTYKYDTLNKGKQTVTDSKDGQTVDEKTLVTDSKPGTTDSTATVSNGDDIQTIVNVSTPGATPTFEHDTTVTTKDDSGTVTATTKDDADHVVKVVKKWTDGSQTTYTDVNGQRTVTEEKDGKQVDQKTLVTDPKTGITDPATLETGDGVQTIVNAGKSGAAPTFEHDTTQTTKDDAGNTTATTKDADGKVVKVVKQWTDGTQTIYADDNGTRTVTEKKGDQTLGQQTFNSADDPLTLTDDANTNTIVALDPTGKLPTFSHETTKTDGDTTTTTDAEDNVVKAVKKWPDDTQTTYTYNPVTKVQTVTGEKDGSEPKPFATDPTTEKPATTATVSNSDDIQTIVNVSKPGAAPTFEHDTTVTSKDSSGNVVATTKDDAENVVKVVKTWPNDDNTTSTTTYTYDPGTKAQTVTEEKDGKQVDQKTLVSDPTTGITAKATLNSGAAAQTIVNPVEPGKMPTFEHDTTVTSKDDSGTVTATTKDDAGDTVQVVKKWSDGTQTTYTLNPSTGKGVVSEQKNGKTVVDSQEISADSPKVTIADDDKTSTIVTYDPTTKLATFEHDTTDTTKDDSGVVTTVTKDDAGNVIKVVKTWPNDNSTTTYTYDPTSHNATITEVNNGNQTDQHKDISSPSTTTLKSGDGVETIVNTGQQPGDMPTFEHDTTVTATDKLGNVTATTTDTDGNIVKVAQQWKDGSETIYTNDHGTQMVTELRNGKTVAQKTIEPVVDPDNPDATKPTEVTLSDGAGGTATIKLQDGVPTFTHAPAVYSAGVSAPTSATAADKIVTFTKQWSDGLQVVYTYDPVSGKRMIQELDNGKLVEQRTITPGVLLAVLSDGKGGSTTIEFGEDGAVAPTYSRRLDAVSHYGASQKKPAKKLDAAQNNNGRKEAAAAKPLAQTETTRRVNGALAAKAVATSHESQQNGQPAAQQSTELPQTGQKNEGFLAQLGALLLALLITPFVRRRSH